MLISPLNFREFDSGSISGGDAKKKIFSSKKTKEEQAEAPPPPPSFSEEELNAAKRDAYQQGFLEGIKEGNAQAQNEHAEIDRIVQESLENFVKSINPIFSSYISHCSKLKQNMPPLALAIAKKVAGEALAKDYSEILENIATQCAAAMITEPEINITVNPRLSDSLAARLQKISNHEKYASNIHILSDESKPVSDYLIEWQDGSIERKTERLWQQMDKAIENMLAAIRHEPEEQLDLLTMNNNTNNGNL